MSEKLQKEIRRQVKANAAVHAKSDTNVVEAVLTLCQWPWRYRLRMAWRILRGSGARKGALA